MVNVLLSECAWGRLLPGPCWIPVSVISLGVVIFRGVLSFRLQFTCSQFLKVARKKVGPTANLFVIEMVCDWGRLLLGPKMPL